MISRILVLFATLAAITVQHSSAQSMESIESRNIYANADLVLVFQIKRLEQHLQLESKSKLEALHQWLLKMTGIDSTNCTEVIVQFGGDDYENPRRAEKHVGFVFRSEDDIPQDQIDNLLNNSPLEEETHNEKSFYSSGSEPGFYFSDNSLLIAERERVRALIDTESDSLGDREVPILEHVNRNLDICARVDLTDEKFCEVFREMMSGMDELRDSETLDKLFENADSATLQVDLESMIPVRLEFAASDSADLNQLEEAAEEFADATKTFANQLLGDVKRGGPDNAITATASAFCESLERLMDETEVTRDADAVIITIGRDDDLKQAINEFVNMMSAVVDVFGG